LRDISKEIPKIELVKTKTEHMPAPSTPNDFLPIAFTFIVALGFVVTTMFVTHLLGPKRKSKIKEDTFECGIEVQGNARIPFSIKYFLIAILFVLFDVEVIFMYPWAVNFKSLGITGFIEMLTFVGFLLVGFYYIIKKGALKWE
jgi:NADH-quinone oxidoreductase subunit A